MNSLIEQTAEIEREREERVRREDLKEGKMQQEESILQGITWWGFNKDYCCPPGFREGFSGPVSD